MTERLTTPITEPTPITGQEGITHRNTPSGALIEFYSAFNNGDLALMHQNWLNTREAVMSNPLGGIKRGWEEIHTVYHQIFNGPAHIYVEFYDYTIVEENGVFQAVGRERGALIIGEKKLPLDIRTSRLFILRDNRYKQLHHHGSIENPQQLNRYQQAVFNGKAE